MSQALDEYSGSLASGQVVDHREFLSRYSDIGPVLADCLVGLDLVHRLKGTPEAPDAVGDTTDGRSGWDTGPLSDLEPLLGDFRILREIGRGGMGVVYEAEQISLRRRVALKVLPFAAALDPRQLARFKNEVRAAATLDHPGIVAVHSVGCDRGVHYYAMQLINGPSLAELITRMQSGMLRGSWPEARTSESTAEPTRAAFPAATGSPQEFIRYVARLGIQGAEALEYAHQHGIVHRDIKPANLLLDSHGNLRIADFGLARIEADASMTLTGDMLGTLRYASPEQALGQRALIDHRTDIYSLGATLYELLTLHPPFLITDRPVLLNQIAHHEPPRPRQFNREIPPDLETIVLHALSKLPAERYAAAGELAEDLRRFVDGQPIRARRKGLADRMAGLARRHQALVWSAAAALIVTVALALISTLLVLGAWRQERQQRQIAEGLQRIAEDQTQRAEQLLYVDRLRRAGEAWAEQDMLRVVELLHEEPSGVELGPQRGFEWHFLDQAARWQAEPLAAYDAALYDVGFSPDGRWIGCTGADGIVRFHAAQTGKLEHLLETAQGETNCVVFAPDGQSFATAGDDGTVKLWDWNLRTALWSVSAYQKPAYDVGFTPDGAVLASCGDDPIIHLWQAADGAHLGSLKGHHGAVERICFSPDGQRLASAGRDRTVRVWDWKTRGEPLIFAETSVMPAVEFGPDGSWLVAVGQSSRAILSWSLRSKRQIHLFPDPVHRDDLRSLALSTHGRLAATGDDRGGIRLWQIPAAELPKEPPPATEEHGVDPVDDSVPTQTIRWRMAMSHSGRVYGLAFSPDEAQLVSAGQDGKLMRLAARKAPDHFRPVNDLPLVRELAAVGDQPLLATAGGSGVTLIRSQDGQHVQTLADEPQTWLHAAVNPSGNMLAASSRAGEIRVWQLPSLGEIYRGTPASSETELYFVPGTRNLSLSNDSSPWIDPQAGLFRPPYPVAPAQCHAFSPDQQHVAIARPISNSVEIWNWRTGKMLLTLPDAGMALQRLLYSPTGRWLAAVRGNRHLIVWNLDHHEPQFTAAAHDIRIEDLCFTPDELTLMTAGKDGNIRLWHVLTGRRLFDLVSLRRTSIDSLALAYGGRHMAFVAQPEYQTANNLVYIGAGVEP